MMASSEPSTASSSGRQYRLIAEIGRGGMAEVYLAVAQSPNGFNKLVVIKKTLENLVLRPEILSMFMDEARLAARMNHPNVVQTYELGEEDGRQFIAMEFLDGQPYSRILARLRGRAGGRGGMDGMTFAHHLRIFIDVLAGLHHAHELRDFDGTPLHVVHRDATPHNVFITYDGSIKVLDFGIAKASDAASHTATGEIKGKISYMSPEQVRGEPIDRRSDVFAVGILMWEAVAGRRMWADLPDVTVLNELLQGNVPSIREAAPNIPEPVARVIERACALHRDHRYPTALAMQRELEELAYALGMRVDGPEVGRVVSEMFEEERNRVRAVVEAQLGSMRWTGETGAYPAGHAMSLPSIGTGPRGGEASGASQIGPQRLGGSYPTQPTHSGAALSMRAPEPSSSRRIALVVGLGVLVASLAGLLAVIVTRPRAGAEPAAGAGSAAPSVARSESVTLKVKVSPPEARILLDGMLLGGGAYDGKVQRGDAERVLRVEADGYEPKEEKVTLAGDLMMSFSLEKLAAGPAASTSATTAPTPVRGPLPRGPLPAPPPTEPAPGPPGRGIDDISPYK